MLKNDFNKDELEKEFERENNLEKSCDEDLEELRAAEKGFRHTRTPNPDFNF
ncbi:hypothetical protein [Cetobacterium somerae]